LRPAAVCGRLCYGLFWHFMSGEEMKHSLKTGLSFGLTSGTITTLGLMVGLHSGTHSRLAVLGGILTIAIADAFSDALGIHISEESENIHTHREVWESTLATFFSKLGFALTFTFPVFLFRLPTAIVVSVIWGLCILAVVSVGIAREQGARPWKVVAEHLAIALVVVVATHYAGHWIGHVCA
jgi:VIT1/CCC1 family predicted Fe2+/Mn2+ transporter